MRQRYGFDFAAPDALSRSAALLVEHPDADTHLLLASVLAIRGDDAGALAAAEEAARLDANSARAHTMLAALLVNSDRVDDGLVSARRAAELDGDDPLILYNLGLAEHVTGDPRSAAVAFRRAAELVGIPSLHWWQVWRR